MLRFEISSQIIEVRVGIIVRPVPVLSGEGEGDSATERDSDRSEPPLNKLERPQTSW